MRKCKNKDCKKLFIPVRPLQFVCSFPCAVALSKYLSDTKEKKEWQQEKKRLIEKTKTHSDWLQDLQKVFNTFIRLRDADLPCISCDTNMKGRKGDASHFYSVGSYPSLRFDENNVHLGCVQCNQHLHGNIQEYKIRLPLRIGQSEYNQLESKRHSISKLAIFEIKEKIEYYKAKINELKTK
jgi:hypothetical protein